VTVSAPDITFNRSLNQLLFVKPITAADLGKQITVTYSLSDGTMSAEFKQRISVKAIKVAQNVTNTT
jgi:hypothetical protein